MCLLFSTSRSCRSQKTFSLLPIVDYVPPLLQPTILQLSETSTEPSSWMLIFYISSFFGLSCSFKDEDLLIKMRSNMVCENRTIVIDSFSPPSLPPAYTSYSWCKPSLEYLEMSTQYRVVSKEANHDHADFSCLFILLNLFLCSSVKHLMWRIHKMAWQWCNLGLLSRSISHLAVMRLHPASARLGWERERSQGQCRDLQRTPLRVVHSVLRNLSAEHFAPSHRLCAHIPQRR